MMFGDLSDDIKEKVCAPATSKTVISKYGVSGILADGASPQGVADYLNGVSPDRSKFETALNDLCRAILDQDFGKACDLKLQIECMYKDLESDLENAYYEAMGDGL